MSTLFTAFPTKKPLVSTAERDGSKPHISCFSMKLVSQNSSMVSAVLLHTLSSRMAHLNPALLSVEMMASALIAIPSARSMVWPQGKGDDESFNDESFKSKLNFTPGKVLSNSFTV